MLLLMSAQILAAASSEWIKLVVFNLHNAHDVVPLDGDLVQSTVLVAVDAD